MFPRTGTDWLILIVAMAFIPGVALAFAALNAAFIAFAVLVFVCVLCSSKPQRSELEIARRELRGYIIVRCMHALWPSPERIREADAQVKAARVHLQECKARHKPSMSWPAALMIVAALVIGLPTVIVLIGQL
jgi:hypothetical protein